jgi:hypothetical protein
MICGDGSVCGDEQRLRDGSVCAMSRFEGYAKRLGRPPFNIFSRHSSLKRFTT